MVFAGEKGWGFVGSRGEGESVGCSKEYEKVRKIKTWALFLEPFFCCIVNGIGFEVSTKGDGG